MNPTTASVTCPACGQPFLCMQNNMEGVALCPHCAHTAPRAHFGTQIQVAGIAPGRRQVAQTQPLAAPTAWQHPVPNQTPQPTTWSAPQAVSGPPSIARTTLQPSQALMPAGGALPAVAAMPSQWRGTSWKGAFLLLAFAVVCAGSLWMWRDHVNAPAVVLGPETSLPAIPSVLPVPALTAKAPEPKMEMPDVIAFSADAKTLVAGLFHAGTPERRAECILDAEKYSGEIEGLFGTQATQKVEMRLLARIPGLPLTLPGGRPVPLFRLSTSRLASGALLRLEAGADGKRRIFWPLFYETHERKLENFLKQGADADAAWFYVGLRPSHGLDIPAELRPKYLTFDVQSAATSDPHFVACVERDSPLGRFMDRASEWGRVYLARLLVRRLDIKGDAPCLLVLDCEGAKEK